jgi:glycosyltransferase involved in cell wall biosynthesis
MLLSDAIGCCKMKISVVTPTWNEESWLPRLLECLKLMEDVEEIVIADNNSIDNTVNVAKQYGCKVVSGGKPAQARNSGAKIAQNDIIIFIDADTIVSSQVINAVKSHFSDPEVVGVHFNTCPITKDRFILFCYAFLNWYFETLFKIGLTQGVGSFIAVKKSAFEQVNGFNEEIAAAEDIDFYRRLGKTGKVIFDSNNKVFVSARRFHTESPLMFVLKCLIWAPLRLADTNISLIHYKWFSYPQHLAERESGLLEDITSQK